ncbi:PTS sugar transporter subunit IIC [Romboutsia lituseburensis]|uniref:Permease IIC component n=1 Tax=Romboutsia lituseburensis DSM 797 TaxID=1121325 RepID=A0A1G9SRK3_9FIRM|nr:PTS transporter subunit EIIC [Romboutsia lituseburensis]CEH33018.1 Lichenan permease IIC component [Romboutsia lituseburensis]SDM38089.1 PTS system, cellobiose-specific IIC component [Romboutsia lituseburensis DSM 797]
MEKLMAFMERYLVPIAAKVGSQRHLVAIRDGFVAMIPVTMVGAFGTLIKNLPVKSYQAFLTDTSIGQSIAALGGNLWWGSLAAMSLFLVVSVAYYLAKSYEGNELQAGLIALCAFLIVSPQVASITPEGATEAIVGWGFIPWGYISTNALFTAMIVAIVSTELYVRLSKVSWLTIKMPDGVPPAVSRSFAKLLPGVIALFVIGIIGVLVSNLSGGLFINDLLSQYLAKPLTGVADSLGGTIFVALFIHVLWIFGLHGANIALPAVEPILMELGGKNAELAAQGATQGYHVFAGAFLDAFVYLGGSGMILGLVIALLIAGRRRKDMIALGGPPACFNISEPMIFGMPIVLNPIYMIPFVLAPVICSIVAYMSISSGLVPPVIMAKIPWITPPVFGAIMATGSIKGGILAAVNLLISVVVYLPFVAAEGRMEKKKLAEQKAN